MFEQICVCVCVLNLIYRMSVWFSVMEMIYIMLKFLLQGCLATINSQWAATFPSAALYFQNYSFISAHQLL